MAARLTRAKKRLASSGIPFATPARRPAGRAPRRRRDRRLPRLHLRLPPRRRRRRRCASTSATRPSASCASSTRLLPDRAVVRSLLALLLLQHSRRDTRLDAVRRPGPAARPGPHPLAPRRDRRGRRAPRVLAPPRPSPIRDRPRARPVDLVQPSANPAHRPRRRRPPTRRRRLRRPPAPAREEYRLQALIAAEHATAPTAGRHPLVRHRRPVRPARGADRLPGRPAGPSGRGRRGVRPGGGPAAARRPRRRAPPPPPGPRRPRRAPGRAGHPTAAADGLPRSPDPGHQPDRTHPPGVPPGRPGRRHRPHAPTADRHRSPQLVGLGRRARGAGTEFGANQTTVARAALDGRAAEASTAAPGSSSTDGAVVPWRTPARGDDHGACLRRPGSIARAATRRARPLGPAGARPSRARRSPRAWPRRRVASASPAASTSTGRRCRSTDRVAIALARIVGVHARLQARALVQPRRRRPCCWGLPLWRIAADDARIQRSSPSGRPRSPDVVRHTRADRRGRPRRRRGLPVTSLEPDGRGTARRRCAPVDGLVIADAALRAGARRADLDALLAERAGRRGVAREHAPSLALADDGAESPGETACRFVVLRDGLPAPTTQVAVATRLGTFWADLGWEEWRVLLEYDGRPKYADARPTCSCGRSDATTRCRGGLAALRVTREDLARAHADDASLLPAAPAGRPRAPPTPRRWHLSG